MKVKYDKESDILYLQFNNEAVVDSDEDKPGIIIDYSEKGNVVGIEILSASLRMDSPARLEYEVA